MTAAIRSAGLQVAFTMSSAITSEVFNSISPHQKEIVIHLRGIRIPVVSSLKLVPSRSFEIKQSLACLIQEERVILICAHTIASVLPHGSDIEQMLMEMIWGASFGAARALSRTNSAMNFSYLTHSHGSTPNRRSIHSSRTPSQPMSRSETPFSSQPSEGKLESEVHVKVCIDEVDPKDSFEDPEAANQGHPKRPMILTHSVMVGLTLILLIVLEAIVISKVLLEVKLDGSYMRVAYLAVVPIFAGFAFASVLLIVFACFQIFGPVGDNMGNSRYYSAIPPNPARFRDVELPHITIQIPVFMEGLTKVIAPTIASIKAAVRYYESIGGTASIFINDDGMQMVNPEIAAARRAYYASNHIGWCSRPPNGQDGFVRKGRFKKASNMNYCLDFSNRVEDELLRLISQQQEENGENVTVEQENELYNRAFETVLNSDDGRTMAEGNVRLGEIILLVDCDTRVPETCLHMGALEMLECPDLAIVQHTSGVLKVAHNLFETGISLLTDLVYTAIAFNVGSGDSPCFVGHNAFLRWKAIQSVIFEEDGVAKVWSEEHVSEDFHLSLRLQIAGFRLRLATYHGEEFKEGVSLTVFDELARWEKYAYGTNELVFNPLRKWYKGPITRLYLSYFGSNIKSSSKLMVLSYTFTYYAIAAALPLTLLNYLLVGWNRDFLDGFYVNSWKVIVVILIIFDVISPIAYCIVRYRLDQLKLQDSALQVVTWTPLLVLYFSGISFHLSKSILCHFVGVNMEWTATAKELETTGFFIGMDKIGQDFKYMYGLMAALCGGMIYLGKYAPYGWAITDWTAIFPLALQIVCHFLLPLVLGLF